MLELRQLRQFVAVAEELNYRRAAERLHMSQPPLTAAVQKLEELVGTPLLERSRSHVKLTDAGRTFLDESRRTLAQAQRTLDLAKRSAYGIQGTLRLSFVTSATLGLLPPLLRRFQDDHPAVDVTLASATTVEQLNMLRRGETDLALIMVPVPDTRNLTVAVLRREKMALAVPADHPLIRRHGVAIDALRAEHFITYPAPAGPGFEGVFIQACQRAGFYPCIVMNASQMLTKLSLVACGRGVTLVPSCMRSVHMPDVRYLDVLDRNGPLTYTLALASPTRGDNRAVAAFVATAQRVCAELHAASPGEAAIIPRSPADPPPARRA